MPPPHIVEKWDAIQHLKGRDRLKNAEKTKFTEILLRDSKFEDGYWQQEVADKYCRSQKKGLVWQLRSKVETACGGGSAGRQSVQDAIDAGVYESRQIKGKAKDGKTIIVEEVAVKEESSAETTTQSYKEKVRAGGKADEQLFRNKLTDTFGRGGPSSSSAGEPGATHSEAPRSSFGRCANYSHCLGRAGARDVNEPKFEGANRTANSACVQQVAASTNRPRTTRRDSESNNNKRDSNKAMVGTTSDTSANANARNDYCLQLFPTRRICIKVASDEATIHGSTYSCVWTQCSTYRQLTNSHKCRYPPLNFAALHAASDSHCKGLSTVSQRLTLLYRPRKIKVTLQFLIQV